MRFPLLLLVMLAALAGHANDHRVSVYRGHISGSEQAVSSKRSTVISQRAWLIVDWTATVQDAATGADQLVKVSLIKQDKAGGVVRLDYTAAPGDLLPGFTLIAQSDNELGLLATLRTELGWQTLMLAGTAVDRALGGAVWSVPQKLRGRYLAYSTLGVPSATNARYNLSLDRSLTQLGAGLTDASAAFEAAVSQAETAANRRR